MPVTFLRQNLPACGKQAPRCIDYDDNCIDRVGCLIRNQTHAGPLPHPFLPVVYHADRQQVRFLMRQRLSVASLKVLLWGLGLSSCSAGRLEEKNLFFSSVITDVFKKSAFHRWVCPVKSPLLNDLFGSHSQTSPFLCCFRGFYGLAPGLGEFSDFLSKISGVPWRKGLVLNFRNNFLEVSQTLDRFRGFALEPRHIFSRCSQEHGIFNYGQGNPSPLKVAGGRDIGGAELAVYTTQCAKEITHGCDIGFLLRGFDSVGSTVVRPVIVGDLEYRVGELVFTRPHQAYPFVFEFRNVSTDCPL